MIQKSILTNFAVAEYLNCNYIDLKGLKKYSFLNKMVNEREIRRLSKQLMNKLEPYRNKKFDRLSSEEIKKIKGIITFYILKLDEKKLLFEKPFFKFFIEKGYFNVAEDFATRAKALDGNLNAMEVSQAIRNVWIMNSLQIFWGIPLELTPSIYSYSMLYPYTDNFLDNPDIAIIVKKNFNERLNQVIKGETLTPNTFHEERVFSFIEQIESQYNRNEYADVFDSLQLILEAQTESLKQDEQNVMTKEEILQLSFFKGGSSVLADSYLVKGKLTEEEKQFSFSYGTFLQLLDDLQDISEDRQDGHKTLFSIMKENDLLDDEVKSLISYISIVNEPSDQDTESMQLMKDVIRSCTLIMVMETVGRTPHLISKKLYHELGSYSKVRLPFYGELESLIKNLMIDFDFHKAINEILPEKKQSLSKGLFF